MCNSFHYLRGGSERCYLDLTSLLEDHGHQVISFSTEHEKNIRTKYSEYFLSQTDFPSLLGDKNGFTTKLKVAERVLYSREARRNIEQLIEDVKPDIAHLHNIAHHISPSILPVIKKHDIPIVMTLHDYKMLCPNTSFLSKGKVCEKCKIHRYYNVVLYRCKQDSISASVMAGLEMYVHKLLQIYERHVDVFISPSEFLKDKLHEYGIENSTIHLPNFINSEEFEPRYAPGNYCFYFGRLAGEKGVRTLLEAMTHNKPYPLHIAGSGPDEAYLKDYVKENNLSTVTFLGYLAREDLIPQIQQSTFTLFPSEGYENYPMTILESFACGKPVIGSDIGAIPELIKDGWNGLLFQPGDSRKLAEKIQWMFDNPQKVVTMGKNGRQQIENANEPDRHYRHTMAIYSRLVERAVSV